MNDSVRPSSLRRVSCEAWKRAVRTGRRGAIGKKVRVRVRVVRVVRGDEGSEGEEGWEGMWRTAFWLFLTVLRMHGVVMRRFFIAVDVLKFLPGVT